MMDFPKWQKQAQAWPFTKPWWFVSSGVCCWHTASVDCWAEMFALVPQEETLLTSRYLGLLLSCLFTLNPVHHWRMIYARITGPFLIHHKLAKKSCLLTAFALNFQIFFCRNDLIHTGHEKLCHLQAKAFSSSQLEKVEFISWVSITDCPGMTGLPKTWIEVWTLRRGYNKNNGY